MSETNPPHPQGKAADFVTGMKQTSRSDSLHDKLAWVRLDLQWLAFFLRAPSHRPANRIARSLTRGYIMMARAPAFSLGPLHTSPNSDTFTPLR